MDVIGEILESKRKGALAMVEAIDQALFEGSLVIGAEEAAKGQGIAFGFRSRAAMLRERKRLLKMAGVKAA